MGDVRETSGAADGGAQARPSVAPCPADGLRAGAPPARASGLVLIGEVPGSGYREPPSLVRRADGQTIQLTPLLYAVLRAVDGARTDEDLAGAVGARVGRAVTGENVRTLCDRLRELGLLRLADGSEPALKRANPLLALRLRYVVSDPDVTNRLTAPFARLFAPVVVAVLCLAFAAVCAWVLGAKGLASATHQAFDRPELLLAVFVVTVVSAGFHEFGHAAAARYGGAQPGAMGTGLYLVWPAFYTDVTDSYRLGRAGRVRTDLGGLYFNAIVAVAMFGVWWVSRWDAVLLVIATQVLQMVRQLAPLVRFDGYHVLADLTGVPDLYARIGPTLRSLLPGRWGAPEAAVLKPWARAVVTLWVVVVVPVLLGTMALMVLALPRVIGTAVASLQEQAGLLADRFGDGDVAGTLARGLAVVAIALPVLGTVYLLARVVRQVATSTWRRTRGRPGQRALAGVVAAALVAGLAWAWWPDPGAYRPIQAYERGALTDVLPAGLTGAAAGGALSEGRVSRARTMWPEGLEVPTAEAPALAVVMVPRASGSTGTDGKGSLDPAGGGAGPAASAPTWVFPFNRPLPPGDGDNQALAVNTTDGATTYDVAFALVYADEGSALNTNEAYALASCTGCTTVAVAFQVVLVLGQADVVVPQNLSAAVNYACIQCVTYALATQLVLTVSGPLGSDTTARLEELWEQIEAFAAAIEDVPLSELQARLSEFEARILEVVRADPAFVAPAGLPAPTGTNGSNGSNGSTSVPGGATDPAAGGGTASTAPQPAPTGGSGPGASAPPAGGSATAQPSATPAPAAPAPATTSAPPVATTTTALPEPSATPSEAPATTAP